LDRDVASASTKLKRAAASFAAGSSELPYWRSKKKKQLIALLARCTPKGQ
jgi:hypothetical protein